MRTHNLHKKYTLFQYIFTIIKHFVDKETEAQKDQSHPVGGWADLSRLSPGSTVLLWCLLGLRPD